MKKWMLVVWGLLFSMFLGMTAMAAPQCTSVEEDVKVLSARRYRGTFSAEEGPDLEGTDISEECVEPWDQSIPLPTLEVIRREGETTITGDYKIHVMGMKFYDLGGGHNSIRMDLEVPGVTENSQVLALCWNTEDADYFGSTDCWRGEYSNRIHAKVVEDDHIYMETYYYAGPTAIVVYDKEPEVSEVPEEPSDSTPESGASVSLTTQDPVVRDGEDTETAVTVAMGSTGETPSAETIKSITGSEHNYTVHTMDLRLMNGEDEYPLSGGQFVELEFKVSDVHPESDVRVLHYTNGAWEGDSATVLSKGEGTVKVRFTALSPVAILVYNESASSSGSSSHRSHSQEEEEVFWTTPLSSGAAVMVNGAPADLQIGPATQSCSEETARILLGTAGPCSVYMADLWLLDQVTKDMVLPGEGGALITLNVPGVVKGSNVIVRHWPNGSTEPVDLIPEEVGDGYIKVRFTTLGQVAVCVADTGTATPAAAVATTEEAGVRKSPKTSDHAPVGAAGAIALLSAFGLLYFRKRNV